MKKIYQIPTTKIVDIQLTRMIAVSGFNDELGDGDGDSGNGDNALSRQSNWGSVWDDDADEE